MSLDRLKNILESLNKKEYNSIISDIKLGVELELVNDSLGGENYGSAEDYEVDWVDWDFSRELRYFNNLIEDCNSQIYNLNSWLSDENIEHSIEMYNPSELDTITTSFYAVPYVTLSNYETDINNIYYSLEETIQTYDIMRSQIENLPNEFWTSKLDTEDINDLGKNEAEGQQLSIRQDKIDKIREWYLDKFEEYYDEVVYYENRIDEERQGTIRSIQGVIESYEESANSGEQAVEVARDMIRGTDLEELMDEVERLEGAELQWDYVEDGSLPSNGIEIISPAIPYLDFVSYIPEIVRGLKRMGFYATEECGYHIGISSSKIDVKNLIFQTYNKYINRGFSPFTSYLVASQQGYQSVYIYNSEDRKEDYRYTESFLSYFKKHLGKLNLDDLSLKDLIYDNPELNDKFDSIVRDFRTQKHSNVNVKHGDYVELRTLGGKEGFDILKDEGKLKQFLYDAISQVFGGLKELSDKEVVKLSTTFLRKQMKKEPETSSRMKKIQNKLKQIKGQ